MAQLLPVASHPRISDLAFRMSFNDAAPTSCSMLNTIEALSSLQISDHSQALDYKSRTIDEVWASAAQPNNAVQRIVAANFLALFDTLISPNDSDEWTTHINYAKEAFRVVFPRGKPEKDGLTSILDWIDHYTALSTGTRSYGDDSHDLFASSQDSDLQFELASLNSSDRDLIIPTLGCSVEVLCSISCLVDMCLSMEASNRDHILSKLERRLKFAHQKLPPQDLNGYTSHSTPNNIQQLRNIAQLCRLAGLIFFHRANQRGATSKTQQELVVEAFEIFARIETCERTFPLFIVECEAKTEEQRAMLLRIVHKTQERFPETDLTSIRGSVERFWTQEDLDSGCDVEYAAKVTAILNLANGVPVFA